VIKSFQPGTGGWLMLVILATQEAEMRIMVQSHPKANSSQSPILKKHKTGLVE
jgi:hypothetical protein